MILKEAADFVGVDFNNKIKFVELEKLLDYIQPQKYIVQKAEYNDDFITPVLTAGKSFILGYTDEVDNIFCACKAKPVIIFDDFTTSNHWVNFDFKVKSSALKIIVPSAEKNNFRYIYYCIKNIDYLPEEHSRQWISKYSKIKIPLPSIAVQKHVVNILDKFDTLINDISQGLPKEIELREKQYEYYRNKLLSFKEKK